MNDDSERLIDIFTEAKGKTGEEQVRFLEATCEGNPAVRRQLERLLRMEEPARAFLRQPVATAQSAQLMEKPGALIARYKLLRQLGEGGCGVVYLAEQQEPVHRQVALKVIKLGMDTRSVIARFEAERQVLALMDHPNIARVLDAGATETGRPYFVMELVQGVRITDYCDQNNLATEQRLQLFLQVCKAIQHAHQKGIIHRDIKPSNILVELEDETPVPKVIDFGIAKATGQQKLSDNTVFTAFEQFIGTPAYMSPEQAEMTGVDIDTRGDIYALGVLLYELLTGTTPFDTRELVIAGLDEMRRIIREVEPAKPSTRIAQELVAADCGRRNSTGGVQREASAEARRRRQTTIAMLRGDLDWIVMKALEKDRSRRYDTINGFAMDIQRLLNNEPVTARPPSKLYRFQKLVRRNRLVFAAGGMVAAALLLGAAASAWQAITAKRAQVKSEQIASFLKRMLASVGPEVARGRDTKLLRDILDQTATNVESELKGQPAVEAELCVIMADVYDAISQYEPAERMQRRALGLRQKLSGNRSAEVAASMGSLAVVLRHDTGKLAEAEALQRQSLDLKRILFGEENIEVAASLNDLAVVLDDRGSHAEAEAKDREALAMRRKLLGQTNSLVALSLSNLGAVLRKLGRLHEAEDCQRQSLTIRREVCGDDSLEVAASLGLLSHVLGDEDQLAEATTTLEDAIALQKKLLGEDNMATITSLNDLALLFQKQSRLPEAEARQREVLEIVRKIYPKGKHAMEATALHNLAVNLLSQYKLAEAETTFRDALAVARTVWGNEHRNVATTMGGLAGVLRQQDRLPEAEAMYRDALAMTRRIFTNAHPDVAQCLNNLAGALAMEGRLSDSEDLHRQALAMRTNVFGVQHSDVAQSLNNLAAVLEWQGRLAEAEPLQRQALAMRLKVLGDLHTDVANSFYNLARILFDLGNMAEAETYSRKGLAIQRVKLPGCHPETANSLNTLADSLAGQGKWTDAEAAIRECLDIRETLIPERWPTFSALSLLGECLAGQKRFAEAEPLLIEGYAGLSQRSSKIPDTAKLPLRNALRRLVQFCEQTGQPEQIWNQKLAELDSLAARQN